MVKRPPGVSVGLQFIFYIPPEIDERALENFLCFVFKRHTTWLYLCATNTLK